VGHLLFKTEVGKWEAKGVSQGWHLALPFTNRHLESYLTPCKFCFLAVKMASNVSEGLVEISRALGDIRDNLHFSRNMVLLCRKPPVSNFILGYIIF
jgi:hypothetical protein